MVTFSPSDGGFGTTQQTAVISDRILIHDPDMERPATQIGPAPSHVCWGAVFAGALGTISLLILSSAFAYAVNVPAYRGGLLGAGGMIWAFATSIIAYFVGGAMVSYFASKTEQRTGLMHGVMAWVLSVPLMVVMSASAAGLFRYMAGSEFLRPSLMNQPGGNISMIGWTTFISLALGLIASAAGGVAGLNAKSKRNFLQR